MPTRSSPTTGHVAPVDRGGVVERIGLARQRALTVAPATGRVLDVGAGRGFNLAHYPAGVTVVACERDRSLRAQLEEQATIAPVPVEVVAEDLDNLAFADASFDTVVCTFVLCTVTDVPGAIGEMRRLMRADGQLLFLEPGLGRGHTVATLQRMLAPTWAKVAAGVRVDRDVIAALRTGGFVVSECERLAPLGRPTAGTLVRGRAVRRNWPPRPSAGERV